MEYSFFVILSFSSSIVCAEEILKKVSRIELLF